MPDVETEIALLVVSSDAPRLSEDIARLTVLSEFALRPEPSRDIRDVHFDTADRALAARRMVLRVRTVGGQALIAFKGPSQPQSWGGMARSELEAPWSPDTLGAVVEVLAGHGVVVPLGVINPGASPVPALEARGFRVVQERDTRRQPRQASRLDDPDARRLAELALDAVTYRFRGGDVTLYEVEVESTAVDGPRAAAALVEALLARFGHALRLWPHGKLATGRAIEAMREHRAFSSVLQRDRVISPEGVDLLAAWLADERPQPDNHGL